MGRLTQQVALVTGGATGLGSAIARRLAEEGARVAISDLQRPDGDSAAGQVAWLQHDVCDEAQWEQVMRQVEARYGRLDILVNNAGILGVTDATDPENTRLADWRRVFAVNVEGVFLGCRAAIPVMRRNGGGSIINIASIAGLLATPYATAYGASKAAVRQLTKSVAQHCAETCAGIRCNSVHPGVVRTALWEQHAQELAERHRMPLEQIVAESKETVPIGEHVRADDVAAIVAFLASAEARHITGAKFIVDGGVLGCNTFRMRRTAGSSASAGAKV